MGETGASSSERDPLEWRAAGAEAAGRLTLPPIGLGTRGLSGSQCARVVEQAISIGYRYIDTAPVYGNEAAVGDGLRASGIDRAAMLVATKVERDDLAPEPLQRSVEKSLAALKFAYVDCLLIHWPNPDMELAETIAALCELQREGLIRHVGVANFPIALLDDAVASAARSGSVIAVNQLEVHPSLPQAMIIEACRRRGVAVVAYSPMGREDLDDPIVSDIASRLNRTPSQVVLRWHHQRGVLPIPIPDTGTREQIERQYRVFDFELSPADFDSLSSLAPTKRYFDPAWAPRWDPQI